MPGPVPTRRGQAQGGLPSAAAVDALLAELAQAAVSGTLSAVTPRVGSYLHPVLEQGAPEAESTAGLARAFAPFLVRLVKLAFGQLAADGPACSNSADEELQAAASLAEAGVDGLDALRGALRGRPHEIEVRLPVNRSSPYLGCRVYDDPFSAPGNPPN